MDPFDTPVDEEARRRFERDRIAGRDAPLVDYLPAEDAPTYAATLEELVCIDLEFRWKAWADGRGKLPPGFETLIAAHPLLQEPEALERLREEEDFLRRRNRPGAPAKGTHIDGLELIECVGRGSFAEVWRAREAELQRDVAVKIPRADVAPDEVAFARLVREAQSAAQLHHPGIVPVHAVGEHAGRPYVVSELVEGRTLRDLLAQGPLEPDAAADLCAQIADALAYAHQCGVVHRDVKPANVLLNTEDRPLLADFGLAHLSSADSQLTRHGEVLGTPAYMAPEQATGNGDARSDVYSLGVVLYEMLAGRPPFSGPTSTSVLYAAMHEDAVPLQKRQRSVPSDLATICEKAMAREPDRRYASAAALADDLHKFTSRMPIAARRGGPLDRLALWSRRNPALAATIAASVTVLTIVGWVATSSVLDERDRFRDQRDRSNVLLHRALVEEARAHMKARDTGWFGAVMQGVREAAALPEEARDDATLRGLILDAHTSRAPSLESVATWNAPAERPRAIAISEDASRIAGIGAERTLWTRDADGGSDADTLELEDARTIEFLDGSMLAVGTGSGELHVIDVNSQERVTTVALSAAPSTSHVVRVDGETLFAVGLDDGTAIVCRWSGSQFEETARFAAHDGEVYAVALSPDGLRLATGGDDRALRMWRVDRGVRISERHGFDNVRDLCWAGPAIIVGRHEILGFEVLSLTTGRIVSRSAEHGRAVRALLRSVGGWHVSASEDGTLRAWSGSTNIATAAADFPPILAADIAGDGRTVVAAHAGGEIRVWHLFDPSARRTTPQSHVAAFVPGTWRLAHISRLTDMDTGELVHLSPPAVNALVVWDDTTLLAGRADGAVAIVRGTEVRAIPVLEDEPVTAIAVDGRGGAWIGGDYGSVVHVDIGTGTTRRFRTEQGEPIRELLPRARGVVALSHAAAVGIDGADASEIRGPCASAGARTVHISEGDLVADVDTLRMEIVPHGHEAPVTGVAIAADAPIAATVDEGGEIRLHDLTGAGTTRVIDSRAGDWPRLSLSDDGRYLARAGRILLEVLDTATGRTIAAPLAAGGPAQVFLGNDLVTSSPSGRIAVWSAESLDEARAEVFDGRDDVQAAPEALIATSILVPGGHGMQVWCTAASPDGARVLSASHDGQVMLWSIDPPGLDHMLNDRGEIAWTASFSPDGARVAVGLGSEVVIWECGTGEELARWEASEQLVVALAYLDDDTLVSAALDDALRIWDARTGAQHGADIELTDSAHDIDVRSDGTAFAAALDDGDVAIWEGADLSAKLLSGGPDRRLETKGGSAWAVAFAPRSNVLAVGFERGDVLLARPDSLETIARWRGELQLTRSLTFSDDERFLAVTSYTYQGFAWDLRALRAQFAELGLDWDDRAPPNAE